MKLGFTGHQDLKNPSWVREELLRIIHLQRSLVTGVTSLAIGADQIFAQAVLDCAGSLQVILPCKEYIETFHPRARVEYQRLLSKASDREILPIVRCSEEAYLSAGKRVVNISDLMVAVWNGKPSAGLGGTADVVTYARLQGKKYFHVNPLTQETILHT